MARPREFDPDQALDRAKEAFWANGYEATSMADLMKAMGLAKGSIYQAFGDKHSLFIHALQSYTDDVYARFREVLSGAATPYQGMKALLTEVLVDYAAGENQRRGCFSNNTLVELGPHDKEARNILTRQKHRIEKLFTEVIRKGQQEGDFRSDLDAENLAMGVNVLIFGVMADSKSGEPKDRISAVFETFLKTISV